MQPRSVNGGKLGRKQSTSPAALSDDTPPWLQFYNTAEMKRTLRALSSILNQGVMSAYRGLPVRGITFHPERGANLQKLQKALTSALLGGSAVQAVSTQGAVLHHFQERR